MFDLNVYLGEPLSDSVLAYIKTAFDKVRVWRPGTLGTCDFNPSRLNLHVDAKNVLYRYNFG